MRVIVDTSVWSLALRRNEISESSCVTFFRELIADGRVALLGPVRQEILSGIRHEKQFARLRTYLQSFPDVDLDLEDYELAAEFFNTCRKKGIQGANTDFLICAAASRRAYEVLTTDHDFMAFSRYIPVTLLTERKL